MSSKGSKRKQAEPVVDVEEHEDLIEQESTSPPKQARGRGKGRKPKSEPVTRVLEKGRLYFYYRARVDSTSVESSSDVARFYMIMAPESAVTVAQAKQSAQLARVLIIGNKSLPDTSRHARYWGFVDFSDDSLKHEDVAEFLQSKRYKTKTRGERGTHEAECAGIAEYEIIAHGSSHTHLVYVLEEPYDIGRTQSMFNIEREGSFILQIKNPHDQASSAKAQGLKHKPTLPKELQDHFKGKRVESRQWAPADPPEFLNHEHVEFGLVGASADLQDEFGDLGKELEEEAEHDAKTAKSHKDMGERMKDELQIEAATKKGKTKA